MDLNVKKTAPSSHFRDELIKLINRWNFEKKKVHRQLTAKE